MRSIVGQQISTRAAATIDARLRALAGDPHRPEGLLAAGEASLRSCGLSGVKANYVLNLAEAVRCGQVPLARIGTLDDETIKSRLTAVKGIGPWTAEMFLVFSLNRPDILSVGDLGVRAGLRDFHSLGAVPSPAECVRLAEPWRPFRSVAMWYLWRSLDQPKSRPVTRAPPGSGDRRGPWFSMMHGTGGRPFAHPSPVATGARSWDESSARRG